MKYEATRQGIVATPETVQDEVYLETLGRNGAEVVRQRGAGIEWGSLLVRPLPPAIVPSKSPAPATTESPPPE